MGAGPAGIAAAYAAARSGRRVAVVDDNPAPGGQIWRSGVPRPRLRVPWPRLRGHAATGDGHAHGSVGMAPELPDVRQADTRRARQWLRRFAAAGVECLCGTEVVAQVAPKTLLAETGATSRELAFDRLVLATGARERFIPFPGWTLPGVTGAGGLQALVMGGLPIAGRRVAVAGSGPLLLAVAAHLRQAGAKVVLIAEQADWIRLVRFGLMLPWLAPGKLLQGAGYQFRLLGVPYRAGCWPIAAHGQRCLEGVTFRTGPRTWTVPCEYLACGFGLVANTELPRLLGCRVDNGMVQVDPWQETSAPGVYCAGEPTGVGGVDRALVEGHIAGYAATDQKDRAERLFAVRARAWRLAEALDRAFSIRSDLRQLATPDTIVCRCEDVTRRQLDSYAGWRAAKLHTRCGMGACQGRVCGGAAEFLFGWEHESIRAPVFPTAVENLLAGG